MKKLFIAALLITSLASTAFAGPVKVKYSILNSFSSEFKGASEINWTSSAEFVKATFVSDNQKMEAFYTPEGEKIGTSRGISIDELPLKAKRAFAKKYDTYTVKEAILFEGINEDAYFISAENDTESVIVKVFDGGDLSVFKSVKK